jgi:hypothetical protein
MSPLLRNTCVLGLCAVAAAACRDATREAAGTLQADREALEGIVAADTDLDGVLKQADDTAASGDGPAAAILLERDGIPRADAALSRAKAAVVATPWAAARKEEWLGILVDRRAELPRYAAALRQDDLDVRLAAMQAQVELQKRALAAAVAVSAGP